MWKKGGEGPAKRSDFFLYITAPCICTYPFLFICLFNRLIVLSLSLSLSFFACVCDMLPGLEDTGGLLWPGDKYLYRRCVNESEKGVFFPVKAKDK
jgi:hypothetical protein